MKLKYSDRAVKDLKSFPPPDRVLIAKKLEYLCENFELLKDSKKVTRLKGTQYDNQYRFVITKKIRALFRIIDDEIMLLVLRIGQRKSIYEDKQ